MFHFHLTKFWFDEFKKGHKFCEFRLVTPRMQHIVDNQSKRSGTLYAKVYSGYPKSNDKERILIFKVLRIDIIVGRALPPCEKSFLKPSLDSFYYRFVLSACEDSYEK